ncbi:hypothetical protein B1H10_02705 [candidate division KSB1 bacterium 4484_188]|nr:MAG: hypothetical protein B1H10_02705 [candidate division KSB1 bacterium 4484_188]
MDAALDVLVVDDDHEQAKITKMLIERNGFHSKFTTNGQEALEIIQTKTPRLVILDLMMPEIDGLRLCKIIKENPETSEIRVIVYSGKIYEADRRKALALGADLFLTKPTRAYILIDAVKNLLTPVPHEYD